MPSDRRTDVGALFEQERERLFSIAYRMLGSVSEAEDVVQEVFARYAREDRAEVATPQAYLTTMTTRLAIDGIRLATSRRESYIGPWLPEPLLEDETASPADDAELSESVSMAFLVLLETLNPVERAIFLLREAFDYDYAEIAAIVERTPENCRQIAHRARKHVEARRPRFEPSRARRDELARRFFTAAEEGDLESLLELLSEDVVMVGDGGGRAPAIRKPLVGAERVARTFLGFAALAERLQTRFAPALVNGQPGGRYLTADGQLASVVALDIGIEGIRAIRAVTNPEKLQHLGEVADASALLRENRSERPARD